MEVQLGWTIEELKQVSRRLGLLWRMLSGEVIDGSDPDAVRVRLDGDESPTRATSLLGALTAGLRVKILDTPLTGQFVIGVIGTVRASPVVTRFTGAGTFTVPAVFRAIRTYGVGGGGGGGGVTGAGSGQSTAGGGGGGGYCESWFYPGDLAATVAVTVGTGGSGAANGTGSGGTGGSTTFGAHWTAAGGTGGSGSTSTTGSTATARGDGGAATGGNVLNIDGSAGELGRSITNVLLFLGRGGASHLGSAAPASVSVAVNGPAGRSYGGGGSGAIGSTTNRAGGSGAAGLLVVETWL